MPCIFSVVEELEVWREFILAAWYASRFARKSIYAFKEIICSEPNYDWEEL